MDFLKKGAEAFEKSQMNQGGNNQSQNQGGDNQNQGGDNQNQGGDNQQQSGNNQQQGDAMEQNIQKAIHMADDKVGGNRFNDQTEAKIAGYAEQAYNQFSKKN